MAERSPDRDSAAEARARQSPAVARGARAIARIYEGDERRRHPVGETVVGPVLLHSVNGVYEDDDEGHDLALGDHPVGGLGRAPELYGLRAVLHVEHGVARRSLAVSGRQIDLNFSLLVAGDNQRFDAATQFVAPLGESRRMIGRPSEVGVEAADAVVVPVRVERVWNPLAVRDELVFEARGRGELQAYVLDVRRARRVAQYEAGGSPAGEVTDDFHALRVATVDESNVFTFDLRRGLRVLRALREVGRVDVGLGLVKLFGREAADVCALEVGGSSRRDDGGDYGLAAARGRHVEAEVALRVGLHFAPLGACEDEGAASRRARVAVDVDCRARRRSFENLARGKVEISVGPWRGRRLRCIARGDDVGRVEVAPLLNVRREPNELSH